MIKRRDWLIKRRKELFFTQQQVADAADMQRSHYANIENGYRTPSVTAAKSIAQALGIDWIIFFKGDAGTHDSN